VDDISVKRGLGQMILAVNVAMMKNNMMVMVMVMVMVTITVAKLACNCCEFMPLPSVAGKRVTCVTPYLQGIMVSL
jgi:hypothetical protein